jgi:hypothetical protein
MRRLGKLISIGGIVGISLSAVTAGVVLGYSYLYRKEPVLYQSDTELAPLILIQNPFRDKTPELVAADFLVGMRGKTVTESLWEMRHVRFNNPSGYVEKGPLISWKLSNRADTPDSTTFYYFIYRGKTERPELNFATVTVHNDGSGWAVTDYKGLGTSNNS